jgi:hypothetical protein
MNLHDLVVGLPDLSDARLDNRAHQERYPPSYGEPAYHSPRTISGRFTMAANQVVLYFDKQEDALLFTVAASSVMSTEGPLHRSDAVVKVAEEICKASRITAERVLNIT